MMLLVWEEGNMEGHCVWHIQHKQTWLHPEGDLGNLDDTNRTHPIQLSTCFILYVYRHFVGHIYIYMKNLALVEINNG